MSVRPATPELERFVRDRLGCTCPAEVFEQVDDAPSETSRAAGIAQRLAIGGRLLVYLAEADDAHDALAKLPQWVSAGLTERDRMHMNRLRLAIVLRQADEDASAALQSAFQALRARTDERVHLHVMDPASAAVLRQT
ncbi:hypothetical protein [Thiocystis violacea]|uniref:hypothetical protein n=1 Tax=Thiocystis violacea TaxID=13725 RepID=UPI001904564A|nr:hypothetical protein [Thiocystis violacea]MBK1720877.1 hypothetical protein [Thiocystis violacea]